MTQDLVLPKQQVILERVDSTSLDLTTQSLERSKQQLQIVSDFVKLVLEEGKHYGSVPGISKPFLWKAGALDLMGLFRCVPTHELVERQIDIDSQFVLYHYKTLAVARGTEMVVQTGQGSCNSYEVKYRYRDSQRVCPRCKAGTINWSRRDKNWFCWASKGGCGENYAGNDPEIMGQTVGRVVNPDLLDGINTYMKMGMKRSDVDCATRFPGVAGFFAAPLNADERRAAEDQEEAAGGEERPRQAQGRARAPSRSRATQQGQPAPSAPQQPAGAAAGAGAGTQATSCGLHVQARMIMHDGLKQLVHKLADERFCNGKDIWNPATNAWAPPGDDAPEDFPAGVAQDEASLRAAVQAKGIDWDVFELTILRMSLPRYLAKKGNTIASALDLLRGTRQPAQGGG